MIEAAVHQIFLAAVAANHARQRFIRAGIKHRAANPAWLRRHGKVPSIDMEIDCNIDEFQSKRMAEAS
jgi:hypothetical protein